MTSVRGRMAKAFVQAVGLKKRLQALARVEDDPAALRRGVALLRRTDRRRPPWLLRRRWRIERVDCRGNDLFVMSPKEAQRSTHVLLYLHGGGYLFGPFWTEWATMRKVAAGAATDFAMLLYPRAPEQHASDALEATIAAHEWLVGRYGMGNVTVVGTSAGGGLAVALATGLRDTGLPLPSCLVLLSPGVDMTLAEDVSDLEPHDVILTVDHVRSAGRVYAGDLGPEHPIVSPINADLAGLPVMYVFVADSEILRPSIESFADLARAAGTEVHLVYGEDAQHTWPAAPTPEGRQARTQMIDIIRTC